MPHTGATTSGAKACASRATSSSPLTWPSALPSCTMPSATIVCTIPNRKCASVPGRMNRCSSASSAVFERRGSTTTSRPAAGPDRAEPAGDVGHGHEAAVRRERVRAEDQEVVGAVEVRDRHGQRATEHEAGAHLLRHLVDGARAEDVRRSRAPAAAPCPSMIAPRLWAFGLPRYTPTASRSASRIGPSPRSISANASSQVTSRQVSPVRTCGRRSRSGSASSALSAVPFGHRYPWLNTSSLSPRTSVSSSSVEVELEPAGRLAERAGPVRDALRHADQRKRVDTIPP